MCAKEEKRKRQGRPSECGFHMIENGVADRVRYATLTRSCVTSSGWDHHNLEVRTGGVAEREAAVLVP